MKIKSWALTASLVLLAATSTHALQITSGQMFTSTILDMELGIDVSGPGVSLTCLGLPNCGDLGPPVDNVNFGQTYTHNGVATIRPTGTTLTIGGTSYRPQGTWNFFGQPFVISNMTMSTPFTMSGSLVGFSFEHPTMQTLGPTDFTGQGLLTVSFSSAPSRLGTRIFPGGFLFEFSPTNVVPEPATILLVGTGLLGIGAARRKRMH